MSKENPRHLQRKKDKFNEEDLSSRLSELASRVSVVLVSTKNEGNIGAVARILKNTGLSDLRLVNPPALGDEAFARSMGGREILENAKIFSDFEESVKDFTIVAGTSNVKTYDERKFLRIPVSPETFWKGILPKKGRIAVVFGRESDGLRNEELAKCNFFINIPGNPEYNVYNLSHAVGILLYEMIRQVPYSQPRGSELISPKNFELLVGRIEKLMTDSSYPEYKRDKSMVMIRRILSRANITQSEYYKIMGVLKYVGGPRYENNDKRP